jgi:hypothetical protein
VSVKTPQNRALGGSFNSQGEGESNGILHDPTSAAVVESVAEYQATHYTRARMAYPKSHHIWELESSKDALVLELLSGAVCIFLA